MSTFDAVVIGAGPAGLSAALELLERGWRVLIVDKEKLPRDKVCGGFVGPENLPLLEKYGVLEKLLARGAQKVFKAGLSASCGAAVEIPVARAGTQSFGLALSRRLLDSTLLEAARERGAQVMDSVKVTERREGPPQMLALKHCGSAQMEVVRTHHVIEATGVNRNGGSSPEVSCFGVSALFENAQMPGPDVSLHFIGKGHLGFNRFEEGLTNVCYVAEKALFEKAGGDLEKLFEIFCRSNPQIARCLAGAKRVTPWKGILMPRPGRARFTIGRAFCAGDAVDVIDPITGAGISLALLSGSLLARALSRYAPGALMFEAIAREYARGWQKMFALRIRLSRLWSRLGHTRVFADAVIRLFHFQSELFNKAFQFHHRSMERSAVSLIPRSMQHAEN